MLPGGGGLFPPRPPFSSYNEQWPPLSSAVVRLSYYDTDLLASCKPSEVWFRTGRWPTRWSEHLVFSGPTVNLTGAPCFSVKMTEGFCSERCMRHGKSLRFLSLVTRPGGSNPVPLTVCSLGPGQAFAVWGLSWGSPEGPGRLCLQAILKGREGSWSWGTSVGPPV